jgi:hypothetical protein
MSTETTSVDVELEREIEGIRDALRAIREHDGSIREHQLEIGRRLWEGLAQRGDLVQSIEHRNLTETGKARRGEWANVVAYVTAQTALSSKQASEWRDFHRVSEITTESVVTENAARPLYRLLRDPEGQGEAKVREAWETAQEAARRADLDAPKPPQIKDAVDAIMPPKPRAERKPDPLVIRLDDMEATVDAVAEALARELERTLGQRDACNVTNLVARLVCGKKG